MKKRIGKISNYVILGLITILVLYFSLKDNFDDTVKQIMLIDVKYLLIAFLLIMIFWIFRSYPMYKFAKKINKDFKFLQAFQLILRTQFFNAVTPFATGGQPYQVYFLKQCGLDYASSTSIVLENFIVYQIALVILGLMALLANTMFNIFNNAYILQKLIALGFIINTLVIVVMFVVAFSKKMNKKLINFGINILTRLHLVKDKEKKLASWDESINKFHSSASKLLVDKKVFVFNILYNLLALCVLYLIPLIVLYSFKDYTSFDAGLSIVTCAYIMIIGSFIPIPGATGGIEYGFVMLFGNFIKGSKLSAVMLIWRFITYYFGIIVGSIALNIKKVK